MHLQNDGTLALQDVLELKWDQNIELAVKKHRLGLVKDASCIRTSYANVHLGNRYRAVWRHQ